MTTDRTTVLLIENERAWRQRLEAVLRDAGSADVVAIESFHEAERALPKLDLLRFSFAVLDVRLREHLFDQGGLYLLDLIKARRPLLPVLMLSAYFDDYPGLAASIARYKRVLVREKEDFLRTAPEVIAILTAPMPRPAPAGGPDCAMPDHRPVDRASSSAPARKAKILVLAANPVEQSKLDLDIEVQAITDGIRASDYRDTLELVSAWAVRSNDLQELLLRHRPDVVHFTGHGTADDEILLGDQAGKARPVGKDALVDLFDVLRDNIKLVVLSACYSKPQAEAIANILGCAIGMNTAIRQDSAIHFAASFYRALGFGRDVRTAFRLGLNAIMLEGVPGEHIPELLCGGGDEGLGKLVLVEPR